MNLPPLPHIGPVHTEPSGKVELWPIQYKSQLLEWWEKGARAALAAQPGSVGESDPLQEIRSLCESARFLPFFEGDSEIGALIRKIKQVAQAEPLARDGWKFVPVEPTPAMLVAMWDHREAMRGQSENRIASVGYAAMLAAAPTEAKQTEPIMCLTGYQLREALEFIAPDGEADQLEQEVCIQHGPERTHDEGTDPAGLYVWLADYPEEGSMPLTGDEPTEAKPAQQDAVTDDMVLRASRELCRIHAGECQVNEQDTWNLYAEQFKRDADAVLRAAAPTKEQP